jgi:hypothetical protein
MKRESAAQAERRFWNLKRRGCYRLEVKWTQRGFWAGAHSERCPRESWGHGRTRDAAIRAALREFDAGRGRG